MAIAIGKIKDGVHTITLRDRHDINNSLNVIRLTTELQEFKDSKTRYTTTVIEAVDEISKKINR